MSSLLFVIVDEQQQKVDVESKKKMRTSASRGNLYPIHKSKCWHHFRVVGFYAGQAEYYRMLRSQLL